MVEDPEVEMDHQELSPTAVDSTEAGPPREDDDGLYISSYLEEAIPDNPVLQVKIARAMQALEKETRRCYKCNQLGHLQKDCDEPKDKTGQGPSSQRGPPKTSRLKRGRGQGPLSQVEPGS